LRRDIDLLKEMLLKEEGMQSERLLKKGQEYQNEMTYLNNQIRYLSNQIKVWFEEKD